MPKKDNESFVEYRKRVIEPISKSFCAAKWYNATLWLTGGKTTSCHHPPAHSCNLEEVKQNPAALHNTFRKRFERQLMLGGKRPKGCEYCWRMEDFGDEQLVSDRVYKTAIYTDEEIEAIAKSDPFSPDFDLKTLEVSFNADCNFACSYCNPAFSSRWVRDITQFGPYQQLEHSDQLCFNHTGEDFRQFEDNDENPYIQAFWKWWPDLYQGLQDFRVTGGEPLLSPQVWKLFDFFEQNGTGKMSFSVNTNLGVSDQLIDRLIEKSHSISNFHLYTSCEATGIQAEYIRDGLQYSRFLNNCRKVMEKANLKSFNMMMTINALCLFSLTDFLDQLVSWKKEFGIRFPVWTVNILRFPAFLSPLVLPMEIRLEQQRVLSSWLDRHREMIYLTDLEIQSLERLIEYLAKGDKAHDKAPDDVRIIQRDFVRFITQYDQRRNKDFKATFPPRLVTWMESIDLGESCE